MKREQLERAVTEWKSGPLEIRVPRGVVRIEIARMDTLAGEFHSIRLEAPQLVNANSTALERLANALELKLTYLLEKIGLVEVDTDRAVLQLRSKPPATGDDHISYFELLVARGGSFALVRYSKPKGEPRERIPFAVTREVLHRIVYDMEAALE